MGDVGDFLFGGSEDAKQTGTAELLTPEQKELLTKLTGQIGGQLGQGVQAYGGQTAAGSSPLQSAAYAKIQQMLKNNPQQNATALSAIDKVMQGSAETPMQQVEGYDVGEYDPTALQTWYKSALVDPAMKNWEESVVPSLQEKFVSQNAGSSGAANRAIAGSAADLMTNLNSQLATAVYGEKGAYDERKFTAGMDTTNKEYQAGSDYLNRMFQGNQSDLTRATQVPGLANSTAQQPFEQLMAMITQGQAAGGTQQQTQQNQLSADYQKWLSQQGYSNPWLNLIPATLGTSSMSPIVQGPTQSQGFLQSILGAAGGTDFSSMFSGGGSGGGTTSSLRYKQNVVPIARTGDGLHVIQFEYTKDALAQHPKTTAPGVQLGFVAEEVAGVYPEAVIFDGEGRPDAIRYGVLLDSMRSGR